MDTATLTAHSIEIIHAGQASTGAYLASPTFSQYGYSWLRDGTWIAYSMDCVGEHHSARWFYQWVVKTLLQHEAKVDALLEKLAAGYTPSDSDYLPTRFMVDGAIGNDDWWDFQLDGYGTWLWGVVQHIRLTGDNALWEEVLPAVSLTVRYLDALWQSPNYDCWEEHRNHIHPATLGAIYGGLRSIHEKDNQLVSLELINTIQNFVLSQGITSQNTIMKSLGNNEVDGSLLWVAIPYGLFTVDDPIFQNTLHKIETDIRYPNGGVYRYQADVYYGGGEWILLAAWLGWVYVELGRDEEATAILHWIETQTTSLGQLPEQVSEHLLHSSHYDEWVNRWGEIACPLLWSHAMYLILKTKLDHKHA